MPFVESAGVRVHWEAEKSASPGLNLPDYGKHMIRRRHFRNAVSEVEYEGTARRGAQYALHFRRQRGASGDQRWGSRLP